MVRCACAHNRDGSTTTMLCSEHADQDPCLTMAQVTGRRRKGTIRNGRCTNCGHSSKEKIMTTTRYPKGQRPRIRVARSVSNTALLPNKRLEESYVLTAINSKTAYFRSPYIVGELAADRDLVTLVLNEKGETILETDPFPTEETTFGTISDANEWEWDKEIEVCLDFIDSIGQYQQLVAFAAGVAQSDRDEREREERESNGS